MNIKTKVTIGFIIFITSLSVLSYFFINSSFFVDLSRNSFKNILAQKLNIIAKMDSIKYGYFPPNVEAKKLKLYFKGDKEPFFRATNLKLSLRGFQLILGDILIENISADDPVLDLDISKLDLDSKKHSPEDTLLFMKDISKTLEHFTINYFSLAFRGLNVTNGNFIFRNITKNNDLKVNNVNIDYKSSFFTKDILIGKITKASYSTYLATDILFNIGIGKRNIKLYSISLKSYSQDFIVTSGHIKDFLTRPAFDIDYATQIDIEKLFKHFKIAGNYSGTVKTHGNISGDFDGIAGEGTLNTSPLIFDGLQTEKFKIDYELKDSILTLNEIKTDIKEGTITANAEIVLNDNIPITGTINASDMLLEEILSMVSVKGAHVSLPFNAKSSFEGHLKKGFNIIFNTSIHHKYLKVYDRPFYDDKKKQTLFVSPGTIKAIHSINDSSTIIQQGSIKLHNSKSQALLTAIFPYTNSMTLNAEFSNVNMRKLKLLKLQLSGILKGKLFLDGTFNNLAMTFPLTINDGVFNKLPFESFQADANWFGSDLYFNNIKSLYKKNDITGDIILNVGDNSAFATDIRVENFNISTISDYPVPKDIIKHFNNITGNVKGYFNYQDSDEQTGHFSFKGHDISYGSTLLGEISLESKLKNKTITISKLTVSKDKSLISVSNGSKVNLNKMAVDLSLSGSFFSDDYSTFKNEYGISGAKIDVLSQVTGTLKKPDVELTLTSPKCKLFGEHVDKSEITYSTTKKTNISANLFKGKIIFDLIESKNNYDINLILNDLNFGKLLDIYTHKELKRRPRLSLAMTSNSKFQLKKPLRNFDLSSISGYLTIANLKVGNKNDIFTNQIPIELSIKNSTLKPTTIVLNKDEDQLRTTIALKNSKLDITGSGTIPTDFLQTFFLKDATIYEGALDFKWNYTVSKTEKPVFSSSINFVNNKFSVYDSSISISSVNGEIAVKNNTLNFNNLNGRMGVGTVNVTGVLKLLEEPEINIDASLKNSQLVYKNEINSILDGEININGTSKPYIVTGSISPNKFTYSTNIPWKRMLLKRKVSKFLPSSSVEGAPLLKFNVALDAKDKVFIKNNVADIESAISLALIGTSQNPMFRGDVNIIKGKFYYQKNEFEIDSLHIAFADTIAINPYYNLIAQTTINDVKILDKSKSQSTQNYTVSLTTSGYLQEMSKNPVVLTSSPPLTKVDLAQLLTFGVIARSDEEAQAVGEAAVFDILSSQLQDAFEQETKKFTKGLSVKIESRYSDDNKTITPALTLKKELTDRLSLKGTTVLDDNNSGGQEYKLEFLITPNLSISSGVEDDGTTDGFTETLDFEVKIPYGR